MVQHQNETTPEGSEVDYGTTPAPAAAPAPACVSPPAKKKRIAGIGKKKKLEPKSLSFSEKGTPYARSFRRRFFAYHYTVNHPHTNIN